MKKLPILFLSLTLAIGIMGCGGGKASDQKGAKEDTTACALEDSTNNLDSTSKGSSTQATQNNSTMSDGPEEPTKKSDSTVATTKKDSVKAEVRINTYTSLLSTLKELKADEKTDSFISIQAELLLNMGHTMSKKEEKGKLPCWIPYLLTAICTLLLIVAAYFLYTWFKKRKRKKEVLKKEQELINQRFEVKECSSSNILYKELKFTSKSQENGKSKKTKRK